MRIDVFSEVKVKRGVAAIIKDRVSNKKFYRQEREVQLLILRSISKALNEVYGVDTEVSVEESDEVVFSRYKEKTIEIGRMSIINFLRAYRMFLIDVGIVQSKTTENDIHAWACKAFKLACPKSFEKSVKNGRVSRFVWDEETNKPLMVVQ